MRNAIAVTITALAGTFAVLAPASAQIKWTLSGGNDSAAGISVTESGYAFTGGGSSNNELETAQAFVFYGGGWGITNRDASNGDTNEGNSPEHAVDNNDRADIVLFEFSAAVRLTAVEMGYTRSDSDLTVLAWEGAGAPTLLSNKDHGELAGEGWKLIGHFNGPEGNFDSPFSVDVTTSYVTSSQYWLVGAYDSRWPVTPMQSHVDGGLSGGNDKEKILALYAKKPEVPEPSSLLLFGVAGGLGFWRFRRTRRA
jgi:hypothetical protein